MLLNILPCTGTPTPSPTKSYWVQHDNNAEVKNLQSRGKQMVQLKTKERHGSSHQAWRRKGAKTLWVGNCWEVNSVSSVGVGQNGVGSIWRNVFYSLTNLSRRETSFTLKGELIFSLFLFQRDLRSRHSCLHMLTFHHLQSQKQEIRSTFSFGSPLP